MHTFMKDGFLKIMLLQADRNIFRIKDEKMVCVLCKGGFIPMVDHYMRQSFAHGAW